MSAVRAARSITHGHYSHRWLSLAPTPARLTDATIRRDRRAFATSPNNPGSNMKKPPPGNADTEIPKVSFKNLGATPRVKWFLRLCIVVIAVVETATYVKFLPRVFGKGGDDQGSEGGE